MQRVFLAAVKACGPGAALSHFSAAALLGAPPVGPRATARRHGRRTRLTRQIPGITVHRTRTPVRRSSASTTSPSRRPPARSGRPLLDAAVRTAAAERSAKRWRSKRVTIKELRDAAAPHSATILADGYVPTPQRARGRRPRPPRREAASCRPTSNKPSRRRQAHPRTSAGPSSNSSSKPTAAHGTTTRSPARTTLERQARLEAARRARHPRHLAPGDRSDRAADARENPARRVRPVRVQ